MIHRSAASRLLSKDGTAWRSIEYALRLLTLEVVSYGWYRERLIECLSGDAELAWNLCEQAEKSATDHCEWCDEEHAAGPENCGNRIL